jgi:hypothetical protein
VVHEGPVGPEPGEPVGDLRGDTTAAARVARIVRADVAARHGDGTVADGHDPERLARVLAPLVSATPRP